MSVRRLNIYCDESCYLQNDGIDVMAIGGLGCLTKDVRKITTELKSLKSKHGLAKNFETKWTKVSQGQRAYFLDMMDYFISTKELRFRAVLVKDKSRLDHDRFGQTHDDWYYKIYFTMLKYLVSPPHEYFFYLDIKDTYGGPRTKKLQDVLANKFHDFDRESIKRVQQIRSDESELLQLADLLIGALTYANRGLVSSATKLALIKRLQDELGDDFLLKTSPFKSVKFNILHWDPREATN